MPLIALIILIPVATLMAIDYSVGHSSKDQPEPIAQVQVPSLPEPEAPGSGLNAYPAPVKVTTPSVPTSQPVTKPVEKKKKKGGTKDKDDEFQVAKQVKFPEYKPPARPAAKVVPVAPAIDYAALAAEKQASCKKASTKCMSDIQGKVIGFSGSSYYAAVKAYGNVCNDQYKKCMK